MKATKSLMIAALAAGTLLVWNPVRAADTNAAPATPPAAGQRPPGMRGPNVDQLAKQLNLTDDQKAKVKTILTTEAQKRRDLRGDTSLSSEDRRAKMQSIHEETNTQMKGVLTADQFDKWQKMTQRNRRPGGPGGPPAAGGSDALPPPTKN